MRGALQPSGAAMRRIDTDEAPPRERFDYWRARHPAVDLSLVDRNIDPCVYDARALIGIGADKVQFGSATSANTRARFGRKSADRFMVAMTLEGGLGLQYDNDGAMLMTPGSGLAMIDCHRGLQATTRGRHVQAYLSLPRHVVVAAAGGNPIAGDETVRALKGGMAPFLASHLRLLHDRGRHLSPRDMQEALRVAGDLALHCIGEAAGASRKECPATRALYTAARHYLQRHLGDADLTASSLAAALGCSRAHLYRVFAAHGTTIADVLRDARLRRAGELIEALPARAIEQVAFAVGYKSPAAFSRAFRGRYGLSPRDWRQARGG